jgi:hypothetical protein
MAVATKTGNWELANKTPPPPAPVKGLFRDIYSMIVVSVTKPVLLIGLDA